MRRTALLCVVVVVLVAGCATGVEQSPSTPTPSADDFSRTPSPTGTSVEYAVRAGELPDEFESVRVTFRVVFVEDTDDLGPCYPEVFSGPYKPTLRPLPTPSGDCHRSESVTVDITAINGPVSLGNLTAPASTSGHALLVTDVTARWGNGTAVDEIKGTGGYEAIRSPDRPEGPYGIQLNIRSVDNGADYDYRLVVKRFDPSE